MNKKFFASFALMHLKKAFLVALWFCFLTFPIMVIKVNPYEETVVWRWQNMLYVAIGSFFLYLLSQAFRAWRGAQDKKKQLRKTSQKAKKTWQHVVLHEPRFLYQFLSSSWLSLPHFRCCFPPIRSTL